MNVLPLFITSTLLQLFIFQSQFSNFSSYSVSSLQIYLFTAMEKQAQQLTQDILNKKQSAKEHSEDYFDKLMAELKQIGVSSDQKLIEIKGKSNKEIICKKILLDQYFTFKSYDKAQNYIDAFHGTRKEALVSISKFGLKPAGQRVCKKMIQTVGGHVPLNQEEYGIKNWAAAVFSTPSIFYACHQIYSIKFQVGEVEWLPVIQLKVLKDSFTEHDHPFEKRMIEFKFSDIKNVIIRNAQEKDVETIALIFMNKRALENCQESYEMFTNLILDSEQEKRMQLNNSIQT